VTRLSKALVLVRGSYGHTKEAVEAEEAASSTVGSGQGSGGRRELSTAEGGVDEGEGAGAEEELNSVQAELMECRRPGLGVGLDGEKGRRRGEGRVEDKGGGGFL